MRLSERLEGEIISYCYMIQRGKPAATLAIQERYIEDSKKCVESYGLKYYVENLSKGWKTLWIFKHQHILDVIARLPQTPLTAFDHWVNGKLFGYSEEAIQEFLETHQSFVK